jgi:tyrosine-protein kinase Etk/Wzc
VEEPSGSFLDYIYTWLKWRRFIIWMSGITAILSVVISLILPVSYLATTTILPPKPESPIGMGAGGPAGAAAFSTFAATLDVFGLGKTEELDTYLAILESRRVRENVIQSFDLQSYYQKGTMDETLKALDDDVDIEMTKENTLILSMVYQDSVKAAEIANFFIEELDRINKSLSNGQARSNRLFLEQRVFETRRHLTDAEETLKTYQEEHATIGLSEENRATLLAGAELEAYVMMMEIQRDILSKKLGRSHPTLQRMETELDIARNRLTELPQVGLALVRLFREVEIQTRILAFLLAQYEQAKIQEVRDTPTIQIIDHAVPPQQKYYPKRMYIVAGACLSSLLFSLFLTIHLESMRQARSSGTTRGKQIDQILTELQSMKLWGRK